MTKTDQAGTGSANRSLEPCPFCASKIIGLYTRHMGNPFVRCESCLATIPGATVEEVVTKWNRRAALSEETAR